MKEPRRSSRSRPEDRSPYNGQAGIQAGTADLTSTVRSLAPWRSSTCARVVPRLCPCSRAHVGKWRSRQRAGTNGKRAQGNERPAAQATLKTEALRRGRGIAPHEVFSIAMKVLL
jgi:hypothetical protein